QAEEKPRACVVKAAASPEPPEGGRRERRPGQRAREQVRRVEGEVIHERAWSRRVVDRAEAADEVPEVAADEVLPHERRAPPRERDAVPAEAEPETDEYAGGREEARQAAEAALPPEKFQDRHAEEHRRDGALGERRETQDGERAGGGRAALVAPPAEGEPEGDAEEQRHEDVGARNAAVVEERRHRPEHHGGRDTDTRAAELGPERGRPA